MTTTATKAPSVYALNLKTATAQQSSAKFERNEDGTATITGWPLFRAGTFADSSGFVETWTVEHLAQMVAHSAVLESAFSSPPVRANHTRDIDRVKGYVSDLRVEGQFLLGDVLLTEPDAIDKYERGTYQNRSAEIGYYVTNDGAAYWPVFLGVAFVDIPAVEGLFSKATAPDQTRYFMEASPHMTTDPNSLTAGDTAPALRPTATTVTFSSEGVAVAPPTAAAPVAPVAVPAAAAPAAPVTAPAAAPVTAPAAAPVAAHAAGITPQMFEVNGEMLDLQTIQSRLAASTQFEKEQRELVRTNFVKGLVDSKRVAAPQRESMEAFAKSLDTDQYTAWTAMFEGAPELSVLAEHGDGVTNPDNQHGTTSLTPEEQAIETAKETVAMHKRSNMPQAELEKTASFQMLQAQAGQK